MTPMSSAVTLHRLEKSYDGRAKVIDGVDLAIAAGEFVVLVGPSGSGKSTLLRMIAGLEDVTAGEIRIGERTVNDVPASKRGIAMVFQSYALYPHMTAGDNMAFALRMAGVPRAQAAERVRRAADTLQIGHLLERKPAALSGGQRQRVAIGRAIVRDPQVFLFDEPLSNLDASLRQDMRVELARLHRELGATMVYVTHDQVEAMTLADRIAVFDGGVVQQVGTPVALYERPANLFVAGFLGAPKINLLAGVLAAREPGAAEILLPTLGSVRVAADAARYAPGSALTLGVRPEHLEPGTRGGPNTVDMRVEVVEYLGDHRLVYVTAPGTKTPLAMKLAGGAGDLQAGATVPVRLPPERALLFDATGAALERTT